MSIRWVKHCLSFNRPTIDWLARWFAWVAILWLSGLWSSVSAEEPAHQRINVSPIKLAEDIGDGATLGYEICRQHLILVLDLLGDTPVVDRAFEAAAEVQGQKLNVSIDMNEDPSWLRIQDGQSKSVFAAELKRSMTDSPSNFRELLDHLRTAITPAMVKTLQEDWLVRDWSGLAQREVDLVWRIQFRSATPGSKEATSRVSR